MATYKQTVRRTGTSEDEFPPDIKEKNPQAELDAGVPAGAILISEAFREDGKTRREFKLVAQEVIAAHWKEMVPRGKAAPKDADNGKADTKPTATAATATKKPN